MAGDLVEENFSLSSILLSHSVGSSGLRSFHQNSVRSAITVFTGGLAFGYDGTFGNNVIGTFRYGFTGQKLNFSGVQTTSDRGAALKLRGTKPR